MPYHAPIVTQEVARPGAVAKGNDKMKPSKQLRAHPLANLMPKLSTAEFESLKDDIRKRGCVIEPVWTHGGMILDGRHRWRACKELGIECPTREFDGGDLEAFVISVNLARRHLSAQQKRGLIKRMLNAHPDKSDRSIAAVVGSHHATVAGIRKSGGQSIHLNPRLGADGKRYPVRHSPTHRVADLATPKDLEAKRALKWLADLHPNELTNPDLFAAQMQEQLDRFVSIRACASDTAHSA